MNLIYINPGNSSVMEAQVLSLLDFFKKSGKFEVVTLLQGFQEREKEILKKKIAPYDINVIWFKTYYKYTIFQIPAYRSLKKALYQVRLDESTIIHTRGEHYGALVQKYLFSEKKNAKIISDIRGASKEETEKYLKHNTLLRIDKVKLTLSSFKTLKKHGSKISAVTSALKDYLVKNHGFEPGNIFVNPNIAGEQFTYNVDERKEIRNEEQIKQDEVVAICSTGGAAAWQKDHEIIERLIKQGIKVINLSPRYLDIPDVINRNIPFQEVSKYLSAADIGILWRDQNVVNHVASPSKFSEFACNGLFVLHNGTIDLVTKYIERNSSGIVVSSVHELPENLAIIGANLNRDQLSQIGLNSFGIRNVANSYISLYQQI